MPRGLEPQERATYMRAIHLIGGSRMMTDKPTAEAEFTAKLRYYL
jgi:hypothetical protein